MTHPNETIARSAYEAFANGDLETLTTLIADDVSWNVAGSSIVSGQYQGRDEVFGFFGKLLEGSGGTLSLEVHDVLANDEHAVALVVASATRDGADDLDSPAVHVMHMRDGKLTQFWSLAYDQAATDAYWG